jgi:predicted ester cyclase
MIAQGDMLAAHWTYRGTHTGHIPDLDLAPTDKEITMERMGFYRFEGAKIVEMWRVNDLLSFWQQIGVSPPLGEGEE